MTPRTIRADGVDWPLATFIDAYRFMTVDRFILPDLRREQRLAVLDDAGRIHSPIDVAQVDWCRTIAWRTLDAADAPEPCFLCGTSLDAHQVCDDCNEQAEPYA